MNSIKFFSIVMCLVALANAAPTTDSPAGQESTPTTTTPASSESSSTTQTANQPQSDASSTSVHEKQGDESVVPLAHEQLTKQSAFTCYGRSIGYYADIERDCKVYHFCLLGDYNGDAVYQRITYLCLKDTVFDQQVLDCVDSNKMSITCKDSEAHYVTSNASLRQEIVGHKLHGNETVNGTSSTTTTAPST